MNGEFAARRALDAVFRAEAGRLNATLIPLLGSFDRAEDALHDAVATALERWPIEGVPRNPAAWLTTTARRKAIDRLRREDTRARKADEVKRLLTDAADAADDETAGDDQLPLIFTCCHPALPMDAQVGLTLRTLCGLSTTEIARAFLLPEPTLAQRLVRARHKIERAGIPYRVPPPELFAERLESVLAVVYLVFNEGYAASAGDAHIRRSLCAEAIRLGRLLHRLMPTEAEVEGLLALMLLHDARREARLQADGGIVLLEDQDRGRWDAAQLDEGIAHVRTALTRRRPGAYQIQAAIAAVHAEAQSAETTDWAQIEALYRALLDYQPTPVVALNHAVAVAMARGPAEALPLLDALEGERGMERYPYLPAARADLLRRLGRRDEAAVAYREAIERTANLPERRYLERRLAEVAG